MNGRIARRLRNGKYVKNARPEFQRRAYKAVKKMYKQGFDIELLT